ncbi:MAG TPA: peptide ABC transporter permease, partial [Achromobacter sp.]|nr:peptide ABC transporter permease [Achromobacter sp.]
MNTPTLTPATAAAAPLELSASTLRWRRLRRNKALLAGGGILFVIVLIALLAPWISPHDPYYQDLANRTVPPVWYEKGTWLHPLGTDQLGRDYLSRLFYGARISL